MTDVTRNATAASEPAAQRRPAARRAVSAHDRVLDADEHDVLIEDRQSDVELDPRRYRILVGQVLSDEGVPPRSQTAVAFVGAAEMALLNEAHMGHSGPTDVLAFPLDLAAGARALPAPKRTEADDCPVADAPPGGLLVGDVVVCPAVAAANAAAGEGSRPGHDGSVTAEIDVLVVHGVLHLLGMDHAEPAEGAAMRARESEHLRRSWRGHRQDDRQGER